MKYLAIQCIQGNFRSNQIPIFITLKDFAENSHQRSFLNFVNQLFANYDVTSSQVTILLKHGRCLFLLDGLDEVREEDSKWVTEQIEDFSSKYFYGQEFEFDRKLFLQERKIKLNELETQKIVESYSHEELSSDQNEITESFSKDISDKVNFFTENNYFLDYNFTQFNKVYPDRDRIFFPIKNPDKSYSDEYPDIEEHLDRGLRFLSNKNPDKNYSNCFVITCRIAAKEYTFPSFVEVEVADFDDKQIKIFSEKWFKLKDPIKGKSFIKKLLELPSVRELGSNPLLLTLLCLVFEESANFPLNRSELYKEGIYILLKKWDAQRNIERHLIYKNLSVPRKEDLLSQVGFITFDRKDYFFKQRTIEHHIANYIRNLPNAQPESENLLIDSEMVLKAIEAQHGLLVERAKGIYSFSHLTFHEYFTAKKIITTSDPEELGKTLDNLASHVLERRWREVFLLSVGMLQSANYLFKLMKRNIDNLLNSDDKLKEFIELLNRKALSVKAVYKLNAVRAFYLELIFFYEEIKVDFPDFQLAFKLDHTLEVVNFYYYYLALEEDYNVVLDKVLSYDLSIARDYNPVIKQAIQVLVDQLPKRENLGVWIQNNLNDWIEKLRIVMIKYREIGHKWHFDNSQKELLKQYYYANILLLECLNTDCYVSLNLREEIEETLLLPVSEIDKWKLKQSSIKDM